MKKGEKSMVIMAPDHCSKGWNSEIYPYNCPID